MARDLSQQAWVLFLFLCLATDMLFIGFHFLHAFTRFLPEIYFDVSYDRGGAEAFQYVKEYWIMLLLVWLAWARSSPSYLSWAAVFGYIGFDDALMVHERVGEKIAEALEFPAMFGLRSVDFGELTVYAIAGLVLLPFLLAAYRWGDSTFRRVSRHLVGLLLVFALFGGVVDMIHIMVTHPTINTILGLVEDGGEMVVMSIIVGYVVHQALAPSKVPVVSME